MKKTIKLFAGILFIILAGYGTGLAQDTPLPDTYRQFARQFVVIHEEYTEMESSKTLQFNNESNPAEVKIPVTNDFNLLIIEVHGTFQRGETLVELFDPKGNKKGFFTIKTESSISKGSNTAVMEKVSGKLAKHYRDPASGDWLIKISPDKAVGYIKINTTLAYRPNTSIPGQYSPDAYVPRKDYNNNDTK